MAPTAESIEFCDALPSYVEAHLDQWLEGGGLFCPWLSYVKAKEPPVSA